MIYKFKINPNEDLERCTIISSGQYIIHAYTKHSDKYLDLRLNCGDYLSGWRIYGYGELACEMWGEPKLPHNPGVLEDSNFTCIDRGIFKWYANSEKDWLLELESESGQTKVYTVERHWGLPANIQSAIITLTEEKGYSPEEVLTLLNEGLQAREWVITKICGIGKYIEGEAFCEQAWRDVLKKKPFHELRECLTSWQKRLHPDGSSIRLTKPSKLNEVSGEDPETLNKLLQLVGGR